MTTTPPHIDTGARRTRVGMVATGAVIAMLAVGLVIAGASSLWSDDDGYFTSDDHRFSASTPALVADNEDVDLDVVDGFLDGGEGDLRLDVSSDQDVFVGVAATKDVDRYLRGVSRTSVTDLDYDPFSASYSDRDGLRRAAVPASRDFWKASAVGSGSQRLTWDIEGDDWSIVVMNADGSSGVDADVEAGLRLSWMEGVAYSILGSGVLLYAGATALIIVGFRGRRVPSAAPPASAAAPAAA